MDLSPLKEALADPKYAGMTFSQMSDAMNTLGPTITLTSIDKGDFLLNVVAPAALALSSASSAIQEKWEPILQVVDAASDTINLAHPSVTSLMAMAVADGIITQDMVTATTTRVGTVVESILGAGVVCTETLIEAALASGS